jgi:hypothetical protein
MATQSKKCTDVSYSLSIEATEKICVVDICQFSTLFKLNIAGQKGRTWPKFQQVRRGEGPVATPSRRGHVLYDTCASTA